jgi:hypothetical protein
VLSNSKRYQMKKNKLLSPLICFVLFTILISCKHQSSIKELTIKGLTIQIKKMENEPGDLTSVVYAARLIPAKTIQKESDTSKTKLWYKMDSCFYIQNGKEKIYASLVQPIANGISGSFEYMLSFDSQDDGFKRDKILVYQDRYLNHIKYAIGIGNE